MNPNVPEMPDRTFKQKVLDGEIRDRWFILIAAVPIFGGVLVYYHYDLTVPRTVRLYGLTMIVASLVGYPFVERIVEWLWKPNYTYLVDIAGDSNELEVWELPPASWRALEVTKDELYEIRGLDPTWGCKNFDPDEGTCEGTWRGTATDLELIKKREEISDIRGTLEELAREGLVYRSKQSGIVRHSVRSIIKAFVSDFEGETVYAGDSIDDAVEKALEDHDLDLDRPDPGTPQVGDDGSSAEVNVDDVGGAPGGSAEETGAADD